MLTYLCIEGVHIISDQPDSKCSDQFRADWRVELSVISSALVLHCCFTSPSSVFIFHKSCGTWGDLLHQDRGRRGQSEAMRIEIRVPLDLNVEAERVIPLI